MLDIKNLLKHFTIYKSRRVVVAKRGLSQRLEDYLWKPALGKFNLTSNTANNSRILKKFASVEFVLDNFKIICTRRGVLRILK